LAFEWQKWEAQQEDKKRAEEFERQKWEAEKELARQKIGVEREERRRMEDLERQKLEADRQHWLADQARENAYLEMKKEMDDKKKQEEAATTKLLGDVMRSSMVKMGFDPIDALAFFNNVEQLFATYSVPEKLQAKLINPYLSERAQRIVGKLRPEVACDYKQVKATILKEFKLSAQTYLERFNSCVKEVDETYVAFASKLSGWLNYYLDSRGVSTFEQMRELMTCDRIKSSLSSACLQYVISVESSSETGWLSLQKLTESIDRYVAMGPGNVPSHKQYGQHGPGSPKPQFKPQMPQTHVKPYEKPKARYTLPVRTGRLNGPVRTAASTHYPFKRPVRTGVF